MGNGISGPPKKIRKVGDGRRFFGHPSRLTPDIFVAFSIVLLNDFLSTRDLLTLSSVSTESNQMVKISGIWASLSRSQFPAGERELVRNPGSQKGSETYFFNLFRDLYRTWYTYPTLDPPIRHTYPTMNPVGRCEPSKCKLCIRLCLDGRVIYQYVIKSCVIAALYNVQEVGQPNVPFVYRCRIRKNRRPKVCPARWVKFNDHYSVPDREGVTAIRYYGEEDAYSYDMHLSGTVAWKIVPAENFWEKLSLTVHLLPEGATDGVVSPVRIGRYELSKTWLSPFLKNTPSHMIGTLWNSYADQIQDDGVAQLSTTNRVSISDRLEYVLEFKDASSKNSRTSAGRIMKKYISDKDRKLETPNNPEGWLLSFNRKPYFRFSFRHEKSNSYPAGFVALSQFEVTRGSFGSHFPNSNRLVMDMVKEEDV